MPERLDVLTRTAEDALRLRGTPARGRAPRSSRALVNGGHGGGARTGWRARERRTAPVSPGRCSVDGDMRRQRRTTFLRAARAAFTRVDAGSAGCARRRPALTACITVNAGRAARQPLLPALTGPPDPLLIAAVRTPTRETPHRDKRSRWRRRGFGAAAPAPRGRTWRRRCSEWSARASTSAAARPSHCSASSTGAASTAGGARPRARAARCPSPAVPPTPR